MAFQMNHQWTQTFFRLILKAKAVAIISIIWFAAKRIENLVSFFMNQNRNKEIIINVFSAACENVRSPAYSDISDDDSNTPVDTSTLGKYILTI